jgi:hypothetical protein
LARARATCIDAIPLDDSELHDPEEEFRQVSVSTNRVQVRHSPYLDIYCGHFPIRLTVDSGATGNMIRTSTAAQLNAKITASSQSANQADGSPP